ncbi:MAG: flagellar hook capping protein [Agathobacter sp.]|nr:flagellar hook capping protein [Agathobacter sp.]
MANIIAPVEDGKLNYEYTDNSKQNGINPTGSTLGYDQFLQLLCAEMQYQDPLEPTSNTDYVAQMATFSQLEATLSLAETQENANASNLVGKQVILKVTSETTGQTSYVDGRVDYVMYENGEVFLSVNDQLYPASSLDTVADSEYYEGVTIATSLKDMVGSLPLMENLTVEWEKAVTQLRDVYEGMTDYQKQFVPTETMNTLKEYEDRMKELIAQAEENSGAAEEGTTEGSEDEIVTV